jgi:tetratricopeptide (TPR) repeat protein
MSERNPPSPPADATLLPRPGRAFLDQWNGLQDLAELFIPVALRSRAGDRAPSETEVFDHIDVGGSRYSEGEREWTVGIVATDRRLFTDDIVTAGLPTAVALRRYFHAGQHDGVAFNPPDDYSAFETTGHVVLRFGLPRLIGLVESADPLAGGASHAELAAGSMRDDRVYTAHHHAALAREQGAPLDDYCFTELDTLRRLSLWDALRSYKGWYQDKGGTRLGRLTLWSAEELIASGKPHHALEAAEPFLEDAEVAARAWLEKARALHALGRLGEALEAFDRSLALEPGVCETLLGKGIALRGQHWESGDREGLLAAASCFEAVRAAGDYSLPEATHHLATIHLALGDWPEVERLSRDALRLRKSDVTRRNLCLALRAQERIDEALVHFEFLSRHAPDQAEPLRKYFEESAPS